MSSNDERQPGESELDYHHRMEQGRAAKQHHDATAKRQRYMPATNDAFRTVAAEVEDALTDLVGATKITIGVAQTTNAVAIGSIISRSRSNHEVTMMLTVLSRMESSNAVGEMAYTIAGNVSVRDSVGNHKSFEIKSVPNVHGMDRPGVDLDHLGKEIRGFVMGIPQ